ncbi:MAG: hypothetical protein K8Q88_00030 [Nitrosarchaeum sp.]|nr:hypothetical protein [Nitrosarchaeum sp.]
MLDECIPIHWSNSISLFNGNYELSVNRVGHGENDEKVLKYAIKHKQTLVTGDIRLTLWSILENHPVLFLKRTGELYLIESNSKKLTTVKVIDPITKYLSEQGKIIIP